MKNNADENIFRVEENAEGITFPVHVQPKASRNEIVGATGKELKVRLTAPPVEGAANTLCREFFAKLFHVPKSAVRIVTGEKSRHKVVAIQGADRERALALLNQQ